MKDEYSELLLSNSSGVRIMDVGRVFKMIKRSTCVLFMAIAFQGVAQTQQSPSVQNVSVSAADLPIARIDGGNRLYIRGSKVEKTYRVCVTHLGFNSLSEAKDYFSLLGLEYVKFNAESKDYVLMSLDVNESTSENWSVTDWNEYFSRSQVDK
ncbi:MAG: hypothetical protein MK066_05635 [Crocinitomicaceae bacterium]|nr:hypothetical protein [Crocinitomicaceae bacterium]